MTTGFDNHCLLSVRIDSAIQYPPPDSTGMIQKLIFLNHKIDYNVDALRNANSLY